MMVAAEQDFLLGVKAIVNIFIEPKNGSKVHIPGFQDMRSRQTACVQHTLLPPPNTRCCRRPTHAAAAAQHCHTLLPCRAAATA
jgi:hypothetical protein